MEKIFIDKKHFMNNIFKLTLLRNFNDDINTKSNNYRIGKNN